MRKTWLLTTSLLLSLALAFPAAAQRKRGPGAPTPARTAEQCKDQSGAAAEACKALGAYLDASKTKKWNDVRKLTHPKTLERIANIKKNVGEERHSMAPWYWADHTYLLNDWKLENLESAAQGTFVIEISERTYQVAEDGFAEWEPASFLVGRKDGKWYVTDRRSGGGGFTETAIQNMKDYFDAPAEEAKATDKAQ